MTELKSIIIDEYLVVNLYSKKKKWVLTEPGRLGAYDVSIHVRGRVKLPDILPTIELGEIDASGIDAEAEAKMG